MGANEFGLLHEKFKTLMSEYASVYGRVKNEKNWKDPFRDIISKDIPDLLRNCAKIANPYIVEGSYGKGLWTAVPWIAVFDSRITTSAQKGVYIVYLLNKDSKELYLTLEIAATEVMGIKTDSKGNAIFTGVVGNNNPKVKKALRDRATAIQNDLKNNYFNADDRICTGSSGYDNGAIYYKKYALSDLPDGEGLVADLNIMLSVYRDYYKTYYAKDEDGSTGIDGNIQENTIKDELEMTTKEVVDNTKSYIAAKGFTYSNGMIENFYLSLKSKPFTILAGTSGTGKTKLVKLFAEAIGANEANGRYKMVSVRPDWSDGSDLFGHTDLNGNFVEGPVCSAFDAAMNEPDKPVFLCLDEMNLARVEYYLSDYLSVIESRERGDDGKITTSAIAQYENGIPDNLYLVGTVNMDETTFPFSKKVLDRANTIEFNYVELFPKFERTLSSAEPLDVPNRFMQTEYLVLERDCADEQDYVTQICDKLQQINVILRKANAHVGYRVRDEIVFYMLNNKKAGNLLTEEQAFDNEIMQKILPRIQGSAVSIKDMLIELFKFCMGDQAGVDQDNGNVSKQMENKADSAKYKESAKKIGYMMKRYEEDGFTSYWL